MSNGKNKYEDILYLPHHVSTTRPRMSALDRAAQFSPFAALSGYEAAVRETARLTDTQSELTEDEMALLNEKLLMIQEHIDGHPTITVTFFVEDGKKEGGSYVTLRDRVARMDEFERMLYMAEGDRIPIERIVGLEGKFFGAMEE